MITKITKAYTRRYSDTGQLKAYVEWQDHNGKSGRTEGAAIQKTKYHHVMPIGTHMVALFDRAFREGITINHEIF